MARGADATETPPDVNEAEKLGWFELNQAAAMIDRAEIVGAATVVAVYCAFALSP